MNRIKLSIEKLPGKAKGAAKLCGVSVRAVYKWINAGRLPRTDYTGETNYASTLAAASNGLFTASYLLEPFGESQQLEQGNPNNG